MLTAIVLFNGDEELFLKTIGNLRLQKIAPIFPKKSIEFPQLIIIDKTGEFFDNKSLNLFVRNTYFDFVNINASDINLAEAFNLAIKKANRPFSVFLNAGDEFSSSAFKKMVDFFRKSTEDISFLCSDVGYYSKDQNKYINYFSNKTPINFDINDYPTLTPLFFYGVMFKTEKLKSHTFNESSSFECGLKFLYELLLSNGKIAWVPKADYRVNTSLESQETAAQNALQANWYWDNLGELLLPLNRSSLIALGRVPEYLQYFSCYQLKWRFRLNANNATKHAIDDEVDKYFLRCAEVLQCINTEVLLTDNEIFGLPLGLKELFLRLKYSEVNEITSGIKYEPNYFTFAGKTYLEQDGNFILNISNLKLTLELLEFNGGQLIVEGSLGNYIDFSQCKLNAYFDQKPLYVEETYRYAHTKYFGKSVHKRFTFRIKVNPNDFGDSLKLINFLVVLPNGERIQPTLITKRFTARLSSLFSGSYWKSNGYLLRFTKNKKSIKIVKARLINSLKAEFLHMKGMLYAKDSPLEMFSLRCLYWMTLPYFKNKRIWLTFDKLYKGGDCGEYFYKYAKLRGGGINSVYVINADSHDFKRLKAEGHKVLKYGSISHRLHFLNSEVIFETHPGIVGFNSFKNIEINYLQNLLRFDAACIQHGLTVQNLAFSANKIHNNTVRYYCASSYEVRNLERPIYGFEDKDALRITGIPRYDGLVSKEKKQILITPTWRNYIAMPSLMGKSRPYNPHFKETNYFKLYKDLISDSVLLESAKTYGYKIIYLLHPITSSQIEDYPKIEGVEIVQATAIDYEEILTESSLMVTDYSGVQFDFAYMRKPIIYYHPDELPPHYKDGGEFYESMCFGDICKKKKEIVDLICEYMKNKCAIKPFYEKRENDFFAFNDLNSCQRIYDDMFAFQANKKIR